MLDFNNSALNFDENIVDECELTEAKLAKRGNGKAVAKKIEISGRTSANVQNAMIACDSSCNPN
ncbi:MAG: hypothetical protein ABJP79_12475 [Tateyamaria sp.]|uniref:hypothetical protein n=1 Tax=Tateyamaria sp. TaxID=1929288 RepID=UPI00329F19D0